MSVLMFTYQKLYLHSTDSDITDCEEQASTINMAASIISIAVGNNHQPTAQLNNQLRPLLNLEVGIGSDLKLNVQLVSVFSLDVLLKHSERNERVC